MRLGWCSSPMSPAKPMCRPPWPVYETSMWFAGWAACCGLSGTEPAVGSGAQMLFESTRGASPFVDFEAALLGGLAPDGGLYVPVRWPELNSAATADDYATTAVNVMWPYVA